MTPGTPYSDLKKIRTNRISKNNSLSACRKIIAKNESKFVRLVQSIPLHVVTFFNMFFKCVYKSKNGITPLSIEA